MKEEEERDEKMMKRSIGLSNGKRSLRISESRQSSARDVTWREWSGRKANPLW